MHQTQEANFLDLLASDLEPAREDCFIIFLGFSAWHHDAGQPSPFNTVDFAPYLLRPTPSTTTVQEHGHYSLHILLKSVLQTSCPCAQNFSELSKFPLGFSKPMIHGRDCVSIQCNFGAQHCEVIHVLNQHLAFFKVLIHGINVEICNATRRF